MSRHTPKNTYRFDKLQTVRIASIGLIVSGAIIIAAVLFNLSMGPKNDNAVAQNTPQDPQGGGIILPSESPTSSISVTASSQAPQSSSSSSQGGGIQIQSSSSSSLAISSSFSSIAAPVSSSQNSQPTISSSSVAVSSTPNPGVLTPATPELPQTPSVPNSPISVSSSVSSSRPVINNPQTSQPVVRSSTSRSVTAQDVKHNSTVRSGGFEIFLIGMMLTASGVMGYYYYNAMQKSTLRTTEYKIRRRKHEDD